MAAIILEYSKSAKFARIVTDENGNNLEFRNVEAADAWRWDHPNDIADPSRILDLHD